MNNEMNNEMKNYFTFLFHCFSKAFTRWSYECVSERKASYACCSEQTCKRMRTNIKEWALSDS